MKLADAQIAPAVCYTEPLGLAATAALSAVHGRTQWSPAQGTFCTVYIRLMLLVLLHRDRTKMEMTTPVFSAPRSTSGTNSSGASMQFVIEKRMGKPEGLPDPLDARVVTKELAPSYVAALRFGGFPLDFEVTAAERRLREAVLRDGLEPKAGYRCVWCLGVYLVAGCVRQLAGASAACGGLRSLHVSCPEASCCVLGSCCCCAGWRVTMSHGCRYRSGAMRC